MRRKIFPPQKEKILFFGIVFLFLTLASLPSLLVGLKPPKGFVYFTLEGHDEFVYLSWIKQAAGNHFLFNNPYAIEKHPYLFFNPLFLVLGKISSLLKLSPPFLLELARPLGGLFLLLSAYWAISFFFKEPFWRLLTLGLLAFSGGISFLARFTHSPSLAWDLRYPLLLSEMTTFSQTVTFPHFTFSIASLVISAVFFGHFLATKKFKFIFLAALLSNISLFFHPYQMAVIFPLTFIFMAVLFWQKILTLGQIGGAFLFLILNLPITLFYILAAVFDPIFSNWLASDIPPFPPEVLGIGYGFLWPLFLLGAIKILAQKRKKTLEVAPFVICFFLLLLYYSRLGFSRKLLEDLHFPLVLGGVWGLKKLTSGLKLLPQFEQKEKLIIKAVFGGLIVIFFSLSVPETIWYYINGCQGFHRKCYLSFREAQAGFWLENQGSEEDIVLPTSPKVGYSLPAITGKKPFVGHYFQTPRFSEKYLQILRFHQRQTSDAKRVKFLKENGVKWYFMKKDDGEVQLFQFSPKGKPFLKPAFENSQIKIFQVKIN